MSKAVFLMLVGLGSIGLDRAFAQTDPLTYVSQGVGDVDTLDPAQAYDSQSGQIVENVYETLYGYAGESVTEFEPRLATDYTVSDDNLTYTYILRDGVTFHSGNALSCKDVEYSIQRLLVTNPSDSGGWILMEPLTGYYSDATTELGEGATDQDYRGFFATVDGSVECPDGPDGLTVQFNLDHADPAFFVKTLFYAASVIDSQWAIDNGMWDGTEATWREWIGVDLREYYLQSNMSGTGAYRLVNWASGDRTVLEAFGAYWDGAPPIKNVQIQVVEDQAARILAIQQGDADVVGVERAALGQVLNSPGVRVRDAATDPSLGWTSTLVSAVFLNHDIVTENNPSVGSGQLDGRGIPADFFSDLDVRKCFNYSFDPQAYIDQVLQGQGVPLTMALPPAYLGYDPEVPTYAFDPAAAEEACRAAWDGKVWENGFTVTVAYNTGNQQRQAVAEILKGNLEFLNPKFRVNVRSVAWPDLLDQRAQGLVPVLINAWIPDYADPDNYVHTFYQTDGYYASSSGFSDAQIDEWDAQARSSFDEAERVGLYSQIGRRAYELAPYVLLPQGVPFLVEREELRGSYVNPMYSGSYLLKDLSK